MSSFLQKIQTWRGMGLCAIFCVPLFIFLFGINGLMGEMIHTVPWWGWLVYYLIMTHITITAMSLSFHRHHTHRGVRLNRYIDGAFQILLWTVTTLVKRQWVAIHMVHHKYSDKNMDLHSPVQDGFWHTFFLGSLDYGKAKSHPEVRSVIRKLPLTHLEKFLEENSMLGVILLTAINIILFGPLLGGAISVMNFSIAPLFAIGGVNALAHTIGYKNHQTTDNSRNLGIFYILDFLICGELNHNNHHARAQSCSFRHRWFELDIGYIYIQILEKLKLAQIKSTYSRDTFRIDIGKRAIDLLRKNTLYMEKCRLLAKEMNMEFSEVRDMLIRYFEGRKVKLNSSLKKLKKEILEQVKQRSYIIFPV